MCFRCLLALILVAALKAQAATNTADFPFELREGLLWVEVSVPSASKPLNFLFDSGAQVSVVDTAVARQLGLKLGKRVRVRGVATTVTGYWPQSIAARAHEVPLPSQVLALDLSALSGSSQTPVHGLIGADFFRDRVVQIDFAQRRIRIVSPGEIPAGSECLPLQVRSSGMCVKARVNDGESQWFRVDTGCATQLQWVTTRIELQDLEHTAVAVGLTKLQVRQRRTTLTLGDHVFPEVETGMHRRAIFPGEAGLLGVGILSRFQSVTIDAQRGRLIVHDGSNGQKS